MAGVWTQAEIDALDSGSHQRGIFFFIDSLPQVRLWLGFGSIRPGINALDPTGAEYKGIGAIQSIPAFRQMLNGQAERLSFVASGVTPEIVALAASGADSVRHRRVAIGAALMDHDWRMLGPVHWRWQGMADMVTTAHEGARAPGEETRRTVTLSVGSIMTGRKRGRLSYWTDADQQARSPGDRFCERTVKYSQQIQKVWPTG